MVNLTAAVVATMVIKLIAEISGAAVGVIDSVAICVLLVIMFELQDLRKEVR